MESTLVKSRALLLVSLGKLFPQACILAQAIVMAITQDEMIQNRHLEKLAALEEELRQIQILGAGF